MVIVCLKKPSLNPDDLNSVRPISNLSFWSSKLVERAVASQFIEHCNTNYLLPPRQSAYGRRFWRETAVLLVYDHICASRLTFCLRYSCNAQTPARYFLSLTLQVCSLAWFQSCSGGSNGPQIKTPGAAIAYLTDSCQVFIANFTSRHLQVSLTAGVPQGSGLEPI